ncbi:hypothetical protein [Streptomyces nodosus]|uniref:hypothetical protein n=1 Tax=Streptomyces nodosus TaxID=40318 RepID=UPI00130E8CFB|nr:hypothetical protein [Streptomyces nodosus]MBB4793412.1 hypothetical protein [Streptomyces nodosus]
MGERHEGGGCTGRPPVRPGPETLTADALLAAVRPRHLDPEAEARALTAFRDAREERRRTRSPRARRRDDWRPHARRLTGRSLPTLLALVLGCAALGGVAVATIGVPKHHSAPPRPAVPRAPVTPGPGEQPTGGPRVGDTGEPSRTPDGASEETTAGAADTTTGSGSASAADATAGSASAAGEDGEVAEKAVEKGVQDAAKAEAKAAKKADKAAEKAARDAEKAARAADKAAEKAAKDDEKAVRAGEKATPGA